MKLLSKPAGVFLQANAITTVPLIALAFPELWMLWLIVGISMLILGGQT
jgi:hypothetical protein